MTIAGASPLSAGLNPALDEVRRLRPEKSLPVAVRSMEAVREVGGGHQSLIKAPSAPSPVPSVLRLSDNGGVASTSDLAFVYGTLKRGFGNHWLMEELMAGSHAHFLGYACTKRRFPLVCGPFQVPFLLPSPSPAGHQVRGELYRVDAFAISKLDELEGVSKGHYERRPIDVRLISTIFDSDGPLSPGGTEMDVGALETDVNEAELEELDAMSFCTLAGPLSSCRMYMEPPQPDETDVWSSPTDNSDYLRVQAYFACADYGLQMADRAPHIPCYTEKEAATYVRRKDRPHGRTFLEHVHAWIDNQSLFHS